MGDLYVSASGAAGRFNPSGGIGSFLTGLEPGEYIQPGAVPAPDLSALAVHRQSLRMPNVFRHDL